MKELKISEEKLDTIENALKAYDFNLDLIMQENKDEEKKQIYLKELLNVKDLLALVWEVKNEFRPEQMTGKGE